MKFKIASIASKFITTVGVIAVLAGSAHAGASQVYGSQYAWNNDFKSGLSVGFGSGSTPNLTVWYNYAGGGLLGYPACIRGWHYGFNPANDNLFPKQISKINHVPCTFNYSSGGTNMGGDFAYDMFLRWDSAKSSPQCEVMVWGGNNSWPIGNGVSVANAVTTGGYTFDLWEGQNSAAGYYVYTFRPHAPGGGASLPTSGSLNVDMKVFFNWLQQNRGSSGHYSNSMYLDVVEAGLEITKGNGWAWMGANITAN